jgi:very-short-patch-repair endonuclease
VDVVEVIRRKGARTDGLVAARQLRHAGVSRQQVARAVAAGHVVRVRRAVYALAPLDVLPRYVVTEAGVAPAYAAHVRAALLSLGGGAFASHRSAAALYGWGMLVEPSRTIEVGVSHGRGVVKAAGVRVRQRRSPALAGVRVTPETAVLRVTSAVQTVVDCALDLPLLEAVVVADGALRAEHVSLEDLRVAAADLSGLADASRVRRVLSLCDPASGSVLESVLRVRMVLAGVSGFVSQKLLRDLPGRHLRVDFCFVGLGLVIEVDGRKWHPDPARDQARDNALAALGWRVLRYTWREVLDEAETVLAEISAAVACATPSLHLVPAVAPAAA